MNRKLDRAERVFWLVLVVAVLAHLAAYLLLAYPAMPEMVASHWGVTGVDDWGPKGESIALAVLPLGILLVMFAVPSLDPKGANFARFRGIYLGFSAAITLFMVVVSWMVPLTAFGIVPEGSPFVTTLALFLLAGLIIALGNYLPRVKPNYTFGIRTPWTLASEDNWRRTHRFAGPVFMVAGAVMLAGSALSVMAPGVSIALVMGAVLVATAVVGVYSYLIWRREGR